MTYDAMILLVIINLIAGTLGQQIILESFTNTTKCSKVLLNGTDEFILKATFGPNITYLTLSGGWTLPASFQILKVNSTQFETICYISIGVNGSFCTPSTRSCYCDHVDASGTAHVVVKRLALLSYSQGIVRFEWSNTTGTSLHSDKNTTLPTIYDPKNAKVELKVNGETTNETHGSCSTSLLAETNNTIQLCCHGTDEPCYSTLNFNGTSNTSNECVTITGIKPNINFKSSLDSYYSICSQNQFILCTINIRSNTTNSTITDNEKQTDKDDICILCIVLPVTFIVIAIVIIIIVCCCCCKKNDKFECPSLLKRKMTVASGKPPTRPDDGPPKNNEIAEVKEVTIHNNKTFVDSLPPASKSSNSNHSDSQSIDKPTNETIKLAKVNGASSEVKSDKAVCSLPKPRSSSRGDIKATDSSRPASVETTHKANSQRL